MKTRRLPCCYFPSTVLFVDDNVVFTTMFKNKILETNLCEVFNNPKQGLEWLEQNKKASLISKCFSHEISDISNARQINIDIQKIKDIALSPNRFNEITVAVVDYQMPEMNGLEFCKKINELNPEIKKIMLTGEADNEIAVRAFNEGIIDQFILKNSPDLGELLLETIKQMSLKYFEDLSANLIENLSSTSHPINSCMKDFKACEFFYAFLKEHNIVEYYLMEDWANFMLLDSDAQASFLLIRDEYEMDALLDIAENDFDNHPTEKAKQIISDIKKRKAIPFFCKKEDYDKQLNEWCDLMQPLQTLELGTKKYYFAHIIDISINPIYSFNECLEELVS